MVAILFIVVAGGGLAAFVLTAMAIARKEEERARGQAPAPAPQRDSIAASILFHVVAAGGGTAEEALRQIRRGTGIAAPVTQGIDLVNWAETYARHSSPAQRRELLELAVQLVARKSPVSVRQYAALLDLSFGLGFQTDALARLRELYGFEYIDHAKDARPRSADHVPLFARDTRPREDLLRLLGITGSPTRQEVSAAYRRLVHEHHPDRYHGASPEERSDAAARFIEITRAYEELLRMLS